jgi:hypothetical protein
MFFNVFLCFVVVLWHGNECGKNKSNENFKTTNPSHNKDRPKTPGECESLNISVAC